MDLVRKHFGCIHIQQKYAPEINAFYKEVFNYYINYHRPCFFPVTIVDKKGRERKTYPYSAIMTPYEKLKSIKNVARYLKPGITIKNLDAVAHKVTDIDAARQMKKAKSKLFKNIFNDK